MVPRLRHDPRLWAPRMHRAQPPSLCPLGGGWTPARCLPSVSWLVSAGPGDPLGVQQLHAGLHGHEALLDVSLDISVLGCLGRLCRAPCCACSWEEWARPSPAMALKWRPHPQPCPQGLPTTQPLFSGPPPPSPLFSGPPPPCPQDPSPSPSPQDPAHPTPVLRILLPLSPGPRVAPGRARRACSDLTPIPGSPGPLGAGALHVAAVLLRVGLVAALTACAPRKVPLPLLALCAGPPTRPLQTC